MDESDYGQTREPSATPFFCVYKLLLLKDYFFVVVEDNSCSKGRQKGGSQIHWRCRTSKGNEDNR